MQVERYNNERDVFSLSGNPAESRSGFIGDIKEHRVVFCIDTSGSMYCKLDIVKEHVIRALKQHSMKDREGDQFNLIEFSTNVVKWAEQMVSWNDQTVAVATKWIRNLTPKTGTNTRDALLAAFDDADCDAAYLITDSIPDQRVNDVIDATLRAARNRPVHCFYVYSGAPDETAVSFLTELAMETFGSFHVVAVSQNSLLERVTSVYNAESSPARIVRSTSGGIYSSANKLCSVGTTVDGPIPTTVPASLLPATSAVLPPWPYYLYPWPYRYYYTLIEPVAGPEWMRFRPGKAWLKHAQEFVNDATRVPVPGAGAMLVGTRVLVRRHGDGLFYNGTVKSQLMEGKFLVEIGPCKHGKFTDSEYQETLVYDIVSHADALRHPVLVDDKVLAPWEPEGERYAPGIVIDGQERRLSDCNEPDRQLIVALYDGKTVTVPSNKALWIPHDFYERITFEIKLPRNVRKEFATQDLYPYYTSCGYPASGSLAFPPQFERYVPAALVTATNRPPVGWGSDGGQCRGYPWMAYLDNGCRTGNRQQLNDGLKAIEGPEEIIPGTGLTKSQLNSKVMAQIMQNKTTMSGTSGSDSTGVLKKTNTSDCTLKKSVSFADLKEASNLDLLDSRDSGHGSPADLSLSDSDVDGYATDNDVKTTRDMAVGTDRSLSAMSLRKSQSSGSLRQRHWKYWKNEPSPSLTDPMHYGPYRAGPYRDCVECPSVLLRDAKKNWANTVEWTSPMGRAVDHLAQYKYQPNVQDCLQMPRPPSYKPSKQGPGKDISDLLGSHQRQDEQLAEMRRSYKQRQVLAREIGWQRRAADEEHAKQQTIDHRRHQVQMQASMEQARIRDQLVKAENTLAAKRQITEQLSRQFQENRENLGERDARKIATLSANRINRNFEAAQREVEAQVKYANRQANKEIQRVARIEANLARISELDRQAAAQVNYKARAQSAHAAHFERKERDAQRRKEYANMVADQSQAILRSQVLP